MTIKAVLTPKQTPAKPKLNTAKPKYTNYTGEYYDGMRKEEAVKKGIYKKMIGLDFKDIDKNGDGILNTDEILLARRKEAKRITNIGICTTCAGLTVAAIGGAAEVVTLGLSTPVSIGMETAGMALMSAGAGEIGVGIMETDTIHDKDVNNGLQAVQKRTKEILKTTKDIAKEYWDRLTK